MFAREVNFVIRRINCSEILAVYCGLKRNPRRTYIKTLSTFPRNSTALFLVLIFFQIVCVKFRLLIVVRKKLQSQNKPERDYGDSDSGTCTSFSFPFSKINEVFSRSQWNGKELDVPRVHMTVREEFLRSLTRNSWLEWGGTCWFIGNDWSLLVGWSLFHDFTIMSGQEIKTFLFIVHTKTKQDPVIVKEIKVWQFAWCARSNRTIQLLFNWRLLQKI